jgi:hypothetical protein
MQKRKNNPEPDLDRPVYYNGVSPDVAYQIASAFRYEAEQKEKRMREVELENKRIKDWLGMDAKIINPCQ